MAVSVVTMQLIYVSIAIMQVATSCIFAGFQVLRSVTGMLVDLSVTIKQVTTYHLPLTITQKIF